MFKFKIYFCFVMILLNQCCILKNFVDAQQQFRIVDDSFSGSSGGSSGSGSGSGSASGGGYMFSENELTSVKDYGASLPTTSTGEFGLRQGRFGGRNGNEITNNGNGGGGGGWLDTAKNALSGPAGQMMVHFAKEMISRSAGNSQVLSLNLSNLLILVLLKALIFTAGLVGAGNWSQYARGRSTDGSTLISADETPLFIGFLAAEGSGNDLCLQRAACESPKRSTDYLRAAKAILKGAQMFDSQIAYEEHYNTIIQKTELAALEGLSGAPCDSIFPCRI